MHGSKSTCLAGMMLENDVQHICICFVVGHHVVVVFKAFLWTTGINVDNALLFKDCQVTSLAKRLNVERVS
jgi:hypothetical protein